MVLYIDVQVTTNRRTETLIYWIHELDRNGERSKQWTLVNIL